MPDKRHSQPLVKWATGLLGGMDTCSGLLLLLFPALALRMMGIEGDYQMVLIRFIGAFVTGVGSLYLGTLWWTAASRSWGALKVVWLGTGWIRFWVGASTLVFILSGQLPLSWASVPAVDLLTAAFQIGYVLAGRFPEND